MHIHGIYNDGPDELICRAGMETDIENRLTDTEVEGERREWDEWKDYHGNTYTTLCKIDS